MPRKSSIETELTVEDRKALDKRIAEGRQTLDDLLSWLDERGYGISRSALHRHSQKIEAVGAKLRQSREMASALVQEIGPAAAEGETGRLLTEVLQKITFDYLLDRVSDEGDDEDGPAPANPMELMRLAKAIKDMASATKINTDRELKIREEAAKAARQEAAESAGAVAKKAGISQETVDAIINGVLGKAE